MKIFKSAFARFFELFVVRVRIRMGFEVDGCGRVRVLRGHGVGKVWGSAPLDPNL